MSKRVAIVHCRSDAVHRALELREFQTTGGINLRDLDAYGLTYPRPGPRAGELVDGFLDHFDMEKYCAVIIGGSSDHNVSTDPTDKTDKLAAVFSELERKASQRGVFIYAACLGLHVGAYAAKVPVVRGYGELGPAEITLTDKGMKDPLFADVATEANSFDAHTGHGDAVLLEDVVSIKGGNVLAYNEVNGKRIVQAICIKGNMYWVQFHSESHNRTSAEQRWRLGGYDPAGIPVRSTGTSGTILRNFLAEAGYQNQE